MSKPIQDFIALVQRSNLKKDKDIRMSIDDANKLNAAIGMLLLELKDCQPPKGPRIIDGGRFK
jgi:hypothetical protein